MAVLNRTLVRAKPKARPALRLRPTLLTAGAAIVIIALLQVIQTSEATTASFNIQRLEQRHLELRLSVEQLQAEVAGLSSLSRIEQEATRLGLVAPKDQETVAVNVPWPGAEEDQLPTRFAPAGQSEEERSSGDGSAWWQDPLGLLPFR